MVEEKKKGNEGNAEGKNGEGKKEMREGNTKGKKGEGLKKKGR